MQLSFTAALPISFLFSPHHAHSLRCLQLLVSYSPLSRASPRFVALRSFRFVSFRFVLRFVSQRLVSPALSSVLRLRTALGVEESEEEEAEVEAEQAEHNGKTRISYLASGE